MEILKNSKFYLPTDLPTNAITKAEKKGLIVKNGNNKKTITINPDMNIQIEGPLFLEYKILGV